MEVVSSVQIWKRMYRLPQFIRCFKIRMREVTECTISFEIKGIQSSLQRLIKIDMPISDSHILNFSTEPRSFLLAKTIWSNTVIHSKDQICSCPDFTLTFHFHAMEKEMATHSSVLAWRIPEKAEPGGLPSMGSHRVGHD